MNENYIDIGYSFFFLKQQFKNKLIIKTSKTKMKMENIKINSKSNSI